MSIRLSRERGIALLALLAVLTLGSTWWILSALNNASNRKASELAHNARVLAQAKQALLGYIVTLAAGTDEDHPGRLPCPEPALHYGNATYAGISAPYLLSGAATCSNVGRLPWRTIGIDQLRDASGEPLWYVVTIGNTGWARQTSSTVLSINSNKLGGLSLNGQANVAVAAIIAPGRPISITPTPNQLAAGCESRTQSRSVVPPDYRDYIECHSLGTPNLRTELVENAIQESFNDQIVTVTAAEVMAAIEGVISTRIAQSVTPRLAEISTNTDFGASASTPIFRSPARFANDAATTFNPENYKGRRFSNDANTAGTLTQGLLPMTASTCNLIAADRCDPNFVYFDTGTITVTRTGGSATSHTSDCSASTPSQITCEITYSLAPCLTQCSITADMTVRVNAPNVGMTLSTLNASLATGMSGSPVLSAPLQSDGSAQATYVGVVQGAGTGGLLGLCGPLLSIGCSGSATITVPIGVFQQHPLVSPSPTDSWYWFTINRWFEVTYYVVAPSHLPSGTTHDCSAVLPSDCLTISAQSPSTGVRAALVLAGRSLSGLTRPNANLNDFLDAENANGDGALTQSKVGRNFNDRVVAISIY